MTSFKGLSTRNLAVFRFDEYPKLIPQVGVLAFDPDDLADLLSIVIDALC
jgi:hypothetical protein